MLDTLTRHETRVRTPAVWFLAIWVGLFFMLVAMRWGDPVNPPIPLNPGFPAHLGLIYAHIVFGVVSYVTALVQVSDRIRNRWPRIHRSSGRLYVFGGIGPAAVTSLVLVGVTTLGTTAKVGTVIWALLSLAVTATAYRHARGHRYRQHGRWMIFSIALALSVVTGRALAMVIFYGAPWLWELGGTEVYGFWLGWMINLALAGWWLRRGERRMAVQTGGTA